MDEYMKYKKMEYSWDPSFNQIPKYGIQWATYHLLGKKPVQPDQGESRYKYK